MRLLSVATVFAALSGLAIMLLMPRVLPDTTQVAEAQAYWGFFFAIAGFVDGMMQETTRAVSEARTRNLAAPSFAARPLPLAIAVGAVLAVLLGATGWAWMPSLASTHQQLGLLLLAAGVVAYTIQTVLMGALSGLGLWPQYAALVALDSGIRLALVMVAWAAGWGVVSFFVITTIGSLSWIAIILGNRDARAALFTRTALTRRAFMRGALHAMVASGASAALITGFAPAVHAWGTHSTVVTMAAIMMAVTLTRAPILVPLQRFQSALIVNFVENKNNVLKALVKPVGAVMAVGALGAVLAWAIGPWIMVTLWQEDYYVPGIILGLLTLASAFAGSLMITGTAALAFERHGAYVVGWLAATITAFTVLALPVPVHITVPVALFVGPTIGGIVHVGSLVKHRPR